MSRTVIAQISDTHIPESGTGVFSGSDPEESLGAVLRHVTAHCSGLLMSGDLAATTGTAGEYSRLGRLLADLTMPVWFASGNHDDSQQLAEAFGLSMRNGRCDYVVTHQGMRIIILDSSRAGKTGGEIDAEQIDWLDRILADESPSVVVVHHPCLADSRLTPTSMRLDDESISRFRSVVARRRITAILSGHAHVPIFATFEGVGVVVAPSTAYEFGDKSADGPQYRVGNPQYVEHSWNSDGTGFLSRVVTVSARPWQVLG